MKQLCPRCHNEVDLGTHASCPQCLGLLLPNSIPTDKIKSFAGMPVRWTTPGGAIAWILSAALAKTLGATLWIPLVSVGVMWALMAKTMAPSRKPYIPALAIQSGHLIWMLLGVLFFGQFSHAVLDIIIIVVGLSWLIVRPGKVALLFMIVYQAVAILLNLKLFSVVENAQQGAIVVHLLLRGSAIVSMMGAWGVGSGIIGWVKARFSVEDASGWAAILLTVFFLPTVFFLVGALLVKLFSQIGGLGLLGILGAGILVWRPLLRSSEWLLSGAAIPIAQKSSLGVRRLAWVAGLAFGVPAASWLYYLWFDRYYYSVSGNLPEYLFFLPTIGAIGFVLAFLLVRAVFWTRDWIRDGFQQ